MTYKTPLRGFSSRHATAKPDVWASLPDSYINEGKL